MSTQFSKRVQYGRTSNGMDMYVLKTSAKNIITCKIVFPGGVFATYEKQSVIALLDDMLLGSTKKKKRSVILETVEAMGAEIGIHSSKNAFVVSIHSRAEVFYEVFQFIIETLASSSFPSSELEESRMRIIHALKHSLEDTRMQARIALLRALYREGHPHWVPNVEQLMQEVRTVTQSEIQTFFFDTFSSIGAMVVVVGDVQQKEIIPILQRIIENTVPSCIPRPSSPLSIDRVNVKDFKKDFVHTLRDKMNVDAFLGIPLSITRDHSAFDALEIAIHILGASPTSRLFSTLRTKKSLTYGSYAGLAGFDEGYPGYLSSIAIFPTNVFLEGRKSLREVVQEFIENGVSKKELKEHREEIIGKFKVVLSTTGGVCTVLVSNALEGKSLEHLDTFVERITNISLKEVNIAIGNYLDVRQIRTVSVGAVDENGRPV